ncbi:MAG: biotin/methionine sulfoxide reductase, partial [Gammaproteobacteria bacterium]
MTDSTSSIQRHRHSSHWGAFNALVEDGRLVDVQPFEKDEHPSPIIGGITDSIYSETRVAAPMVRRSWLEHGPGANSASRGSDPFVRVSWDEALELVSAELLRVRDTYGSESIFGGSYGWASAGRFHHAKTQLQRFLGRLGGFTDQMFSYSNAA